MTARLRVAITADLHWGHRKGHEATQLLAARLRERPPDVLVVAGDVGTGVMYEDCLRLFAGLSCIKVVVAGNHDLWVSDEAVGYDSLDLFERLLPEAAARQGFADLDRGPVVLPGADVALVGTVNWYDYSWGIEGLRRLYPGEEHRLRSKRFTRGKHNDGNFVRWPLDDVSFTARVTAGLERNLLAALEQVGRVIVVAHHPPFYELGFPHEGPSQELDRYLWDAFCGNAGVERLLARHADRIAFAFCGHTHRAREVTWQGIRGHNVGSDYHFKRLLWLDWPAGTVTAEEFGNANP
jgi:3',5'-cyclic AMP phosphodiesterase CpdA